MLLAISCILQRLESIGIIVTIPSESINLAISLIILSIFGIIGGKIARYFKQESMLGMLFIGYLCRNLFPSIVIPIPHSWTSVIWTMALASVVCRAGLSMKLDQLLKYRNITLCLGVFPVISEGLLIGIVTKYAFAIPWVWAFTISFGMASISPGVVVPLVLKLLSNGWKSSKIPPILLTSLGIDVLVGTTGFGIALSSCFGHVHEIEDSYQWFHANWFVRALEDILIGLFFGLLLGIFAIGYFRCKFPVSISTYIIYSCSAATMIWCKSHAFIGAASFSAFITWGIISNSRSINQTEEMDTKLKSLWIILKPFLFPVIGATVDFEGIVPSTLFKVFVVVVIAIVSKILFSYFVCIFCEFNSSESFFICGIWSGKASIQVMSI